MKFPLITIPKEEWRRTGLMNLACTCCCGILLLVSLVVMITQRGSALNSTTPIFEGDCQKTHRINSALQVLISITSTLILASSRFSMQILSSPSRLEVDRAHLHLRSLEIGISSMKNLRFISRYKAIGWIILLISSTPIHLLFSSSVFETHYQNSDWRLTVASSSFSTRHVPFFPPGASLANAGVPSLSWNSSNMEGPRCRYTEGYGEYVALEDYWDKRSPVYQNITKTAKKSLSWHNLTSQECREHYASCRPKNRYRDVVIVADTHVSSPGGWSRSQVFNDPHNILGPSWDSHIPPNDLNSLWYSTQCTTNLPTAIGFPHYPDATTAYCLSSCGRVLGFRSTAIATTEPNHPEPGWEISLHNPSQCDTIDKKQLGYNNVFDSLPVRYCLAEPPPASSCQVGLSNILLLVTLICVFIKAFICMLVIRYLPHTSLVTLGDALESFISNPDPVTRGLGTLNLYDSHRVQFEMPMYYEIDSAAGLSDKTLPRHWRRNANKLISIIPKYAWSGTLIPIVCFICIGAYYANLALVHRRVSVNGNIGASETPFFIFGLVKGRYLVDYYNQDSWSPGNKWGVFEGTIVLLGFWPLGIVITLLAGLALVIIPIIYSARGLPGNMVFGACDSLVLSAACHPYIPPVMSNWDNLHVDKRSSIKREDTSEATGLGSLCALSKGNLRWGVTLVPLGLSTVVDPERNIMHLSFTSEDYYVSEPMEYSLYV
ncbi:hypothetical protein F5Y11DRAFT_365301 [Daldinia sp. FL1419]|nr:hypothetical protein F5Y11DRAFT_365301 [Daldinia sp. FL1419]